MRTSRRQTWDHVELGRILSPALHTGLAVSCASGLPTRFIGELARDGVDSSPGHRHAILSVNPRSLSPGISGEGAHHASTPRSGSATPAVAGVGSTFRTDFIFSIRPEKFEGPGNVGGGVDAPRLTIRLALHVEASTLVIG
jgi:hypothetical protein